MRSIFDVKDLDFDYYRIRILANEGYDIYLNGHKIHTYIWFSFFPAYSQFILGKNEIAYLKKGRNTLAVYCTVRFEQDPKAEQQYHPIGQIDLILEGLKRDSIK